MQNKKAVQILAVLAAAVLPLCAAYTAEFPSWQDVLFKANHQVKTKGASSVLGAQVGEEVRRIALHHEENKKRNNFYASLRKKHTNEAALRKCQANYALIQKAAASNELFDRYLVTSVKPELFCQLTGEEMFFVRNFLQEKLVPEQARQYKDAVLITLTPRTSVVWLSIRPQDKTITLSKDLASLGLARASFKPLAVK